MSDLLPSCVGGCQLQFRAGTARVVNERVEEDSSESRSERTQESQLGWLQHPLGRTIIQKEYTMDASMTQIRRNIHSSPLF